MTDTIDTRIETEGAYEIIRNRLNQQANILGEKLTALNEKRVETFGSTQMTVMGRTRIRTENLCVPRDIIDMGDCLLFGYNVFVGMRAKVQVSDVFSLHRIEQTGQLLELPAIPFEQCFLSQPDFVKHFQQLYHYYKEARLSQLRNVNGKKLAVFQISQNFKDVRVFRWLLTAQGEVQYIDNHGEPDNVYPPSHDFDWHTTSRDNHIIGTHSHVSVLDKVFVETINGDLTIKIENNTEDGLGIYSEPVDDPHQSLADAQIHYAQLSGLILLKIRPYKEKNWRYFIFNTLTKKISRLDSMGKACIQLPEDHGLIFPDGYYLQNGETKLFEGDDMAAMTYKRFWHSPNGEDVLYVFHHEEQGKMVLLSYNLIRKEVQNPLLCHGYSIFADGRMVVFRADDDTPSRNHAMQVWQTPFVSEEFAAQTPVGHSFLAHIGNADLVRGISEAFSIKRILDDQSPLMSTYEQLIAATQHIIDAYHWLAHPEVGSLLAVFKAILQNAELIIDEFDKVQQLKQQAQNALNQAKSAQQALFNEIAQKNFWQEVNDFINRLTQLRNQRGHLISLRAMRYMDTTALDEMAQQNTEQFNALSQATVNFLLVENALQPYHTVLEQYLQQIEALNQSNQIQPLMRKVTDTAAGLTLLTQVLNDLPIDDAHARAQILEDIADVLAKLNRTQAELTLKKKAVLSGEAVQEFAAQFKLFSQSVTSAISQADTPEKVDEATARIMAQLEDLDARFSDDEFLAKIADKREEVYSSFDSHKQALLEQRQRRALNISTTADRILQGIQRRGAHFADLDEQNAYFAADAMVLKVRDLVQQLFDLGDSVKAGDIEAKLKAISDQAGRELRDQKELFSAGGKVIKLGNHAFSVNTQELDLTLLPRNDAMMVHLTGTDFFSVIEDEALNQTQAYWQQSLLSETDHVYRAEYLAATLLFDAEKASDLLKITLEKNGLLKLTRQAAAQRFDEGYERGVHDADAALILEKLLPLYNEAGLLRFSPDTRAMAQLFWAFYPERERKEAWAKAAQSLQQLQDLFAHGWQAFKQYTMDDIQQAFIAFEAGNSGQNPCLISDYLLEELKAKNPRFSTAFEASQLAKNFWTYLEQHNKRREFSEDLHLNNHLTKRLALVLAWLNGYQTEDNRYNLEAAVILLTGKELNRQVSSAVTETSIHGLLGQHPQIAQRQLVVRLDEFMRRLAHHRQTVVPAFKAYRKLRQQIIQREYGQLRLDEFKPRPLTSFVRNQLINEIYLPLIGDNFAKQMGSAGENKRSDLMGMLLLISPPGYGKTTLMEYLAQRLGLIFVKINCPTIGQRVISLDPSEAPNATARQELDKLNLALEMGNNVMLYLDDIQHSNPEFLQKFISLADGQRRIEGIWRGKTQTYDLRGKRFCIAMAGNPYTESGEAFKIPDMLANRADIYNLGDVLGGKQAVFALSYIENCLTSNAVLAPLANRGQQDVYKLIRLAQGEDIARSDFDHNYSSSDLNEITQILRKLFKIQSVVLKVNQQYILSAAQKEDYRTEPPFKLQGSYRNMNKMAEKVVTVMNNEELQQLISDHYQGEAQTLTTGAEENWLKLAELRGIQTDAQKKRWLEIKKTYTRKRNLGGNDQDPTLKVINQLSLVTEQLGNIHHALADVGDKTQEKSMDFSQLQPMLGNIQQWLQSLGKQYQSGQKQQQQQWDKYNLSIAQLSQLWSVAQQPPKVEVIHQASDSLESVVKELVGMIDQTLLPVVHNFERKSRLDLVLWHRVKNISDSLKGIEERLFKEKQRINPV